MLFLDTFHHFAETYAYRDEIAGRWNLNLVNLRADEPRAGLWQQSTQACCGTHKVEPLFRALQDYDVWFTGLRRQQSPSRANLQEVEPFALPTGKVAAQGEPAGARGRRRTCGPTRGSTTFRCCRSTTAGYTSIGCEPCTSLPAEPGNERSGRWAGQKLECGIHIAGGNNVGPV